MSLPSIGDAVALSGPVSLGWSYGAPVVQFPPLRRYFGGWMNSIVMPSASRV